jgi:phosphocarrier protein HPr
MKIELNPAGVCRIPIMKRSQVVVSWREGLHLRPAARLVHLSKRFRSTIFLKCSGKVADVRSILSILSLCATMGTVIDIEARGDDERDATKAVEQVFSSQGASEAPTQLTKF